MLCWWGCLFVVNVAFLSDSTLFASIRGTSAWRLGGTAGVTAPSLVCECGIVVLQPRVCCRLCDRACVATNVCVEIAVLMFAHRAWPRVARE